MLQKQLTGNIHPKKPGGNLKSTLHPHQTQLIEMVEKYPDYTLDEYCESWLYNYNQFVSPSMMCRQLKKSNLTRKKNHTQQPVS